MVMPVGQEDLRFLMVVALHLPLVVRALQWLFGVALAARKITRAAGTLHFAGFCVSRAVWKRAIFICSLVYFWMWCIAIHSALDAPLRLL